MTPDICRDCCCVFCDQPLAAGDRIACAEHRRRLDETPMPWDRPARGQSRAWGFKRTPPPAASGSGDEGRE